MADLTSARPAQPIKYRPVLFSGPMVKAILSGAKTQTRRIAKFKPIEAGLNLGFSGLRVETIKNDGSGINAFALCSPDGSGASNQRTLWEVCPFGKPGDRLWGRETWMAADGNGEDCITVLYRATNDLRPEGVSAEEFGSSAQRRCGILEYEKYQRDFDPDAIKSSWRPSTHMPRWASRLTLEITAVRVERLQEISEADAKAEGLELGDCWPCDGTGNFYRHDEDGDFLECDDCGGHGETMRGSFVRLWESIYGPGSWDRNDWVWVVEFKVVENA